jgi:hypothetical protein
LFQDLNAICDGEEPRWFNIKLANSPELICEGGILKKGAYPLIRSILAEPGRKYASYPSIPEQVSRDVYARLSHAFKEGPKLLELIHSFREHQKQFNDLRSLRESLRKELQEWLKVPVLPNECMLLKKGAR